MNKISNKKLLPCLLLGGEHFVLEPCSFRNLSRRKSNEIPIRRTAVSCDQLQFRVERPEQLIRYKFIILQLVEMKFKFI